MKTLVFLPPSGALAPDQPIATLTTSNEIMFEHASIEITNGHGVCLALDVDRLGHDNISPHHDIYYLKLRHQPQENFIPELEEFGVVIDPNWNDETIIHD